MKLSVAAIAFFLVATTYAQDSKKPEFDVATMKAEATLGPGEVFRANLGTIANGKVTLSNVTLSDCIKFAYGIVSDSQIFGPEWIKSKDIRFAIVAQAPADTSRDQALLMLQNLLADRLRLKLHHEQRPLPFLAITVAKNGSKLQPANESTPTDDAVAGPGRIVSPRMPMAVLANLLSRFERNIFIDLTDLKGFFSINLQWTPDSMRSLAPRDGGPILVNGQTFDPNGPSLPTALQEQLGLRLESRRDPIDTIVVDSAEKIPTENE
jgi:uncharacterized protein (TIGR03435 family)